MACQELPQPAVVVVDPASSGGWMIILMTREIKTRSHRYAAEADILQ